MTRVPLAHQQAALDRSKDARAFALFFEQRCGKTKVVIDTAAHLHHQGRADAAVVVVWPNGVQNVWAEEWPKDWPDDLPASVVTWRSGRMDSPKGKESLETLLAFDGFAVLALNCEALLTDYAWRYLGRFFRRRKVLLVADECFVGSTHVKTDRGDIQISEIKIGDGVLTPSGFMTVRKVFRRFKRSLVRLYLNGQIIICTPNHPFLTDVGWICAGDLSVGRILLTEDGVMSLLRSNPERETEILLQRVVRSEMAECQSDDSRASRSDLGYVGRSAEPASWSEAHGRFSPQYVDIPPRPSSCEQGEENWQAGVEPRSAMHGRNEGEDQRYESTEGSEERIRCRSRTATARAASEAVRYIRTAVGRGACHLIGEEASRLSNLLQGRSGVPIEEDNHRGRWAPSPVREIEAIRPEEGTATFGVRLDGIESLESASITPVFDLQLDGDPRYLVEGVYVHNSSWMKTPGAARTKRMLAMSRHENVVAKRILDATPADEGPLDLYAPCAFLDPSLLGYTSFFAFKARYAVLEDGYAAGGRRFRKVAGWKNLDELQGKLTTFSSRVRRADISDAPPKLYQTRYFAMTPKQRAVYDKLRDEYVAELSGGDRPVLDVLTRITRLSMVARNYYPPEEIGAVCPTCSGAGFTNVLADGTGLRPVISQPDCEACGGLGYVVETTKLVRIDDTNPAAEALAAELRATPAPVLIWARFRQDVRDAIAAAKDAGRSPVQFDGSIPSKEREAAYAAFRAGENDVIVATIGSGLSRGRDLTRAGALIYFSNEYSLRARRQSEDRAEGLGRTVSTDIIDLVAEDTRDLDIINALREKRSLADLIVGDPPASWL